MKLRPMALWATRASPGPGSPTETSSHWRTSGPPVLWKRIAWDMVSSSGAEDCTDRDVGALGPLGRRDLLGILALYLRDLDLPALRGDAHAGVGYLGDLADLALHRAERAHRVLLRAEELQLLAAYRGPCARRRIRPADEVVDEVHVVVPVQLRLVGAEPALVGGLRLVLHDLLVLARDHQVGGLEHGLHAHGKQPVEVHGAERVVLGNLGFLLQDHRALVEAVGGPEDREPGLLLAARDGPVDRRRAAVLRQQRRVVLDGAVLRDPDELLRRELQHEGHDADVGGEVLHRLRGFRALQRRELEELESLLLRRDLHGVGLRALLLGCHEDARHGVAAREEGLEDRLAEILLSDDGNFHCCSLWSLWSRCSGSYAATFFGAEK